MRLASRTIVFVAIATPLLAQDRTRVVRVVDSATSRPIAQAEILDVASGARLRSSDAGAARVSLAAGETKRLLVRRLGYASSGVAIDGNSADTTVVVLAPLVQALPSVTAEAAPDRKLEMMGFYERRKTSAAPRSAFITEEDLAQWKPTLLTDVRYKTGRAIGGCDTYIDGVRIAAPTSRGNTFRRGIDALVQVAEVAAMEVYRPVEAPARYASTRAPCVLLIWLK